MSIFPKRTLRNSTVTIHWNFSTAHLEKHIFPLVKIGVKDPLGNVTMLFQKHVFSLPKVDYDSAATQNKLIYLNKNTPLLIVAEYLSGQHKKEKLVDILENIQCGRHYYFNYNVPLDAPLGKYILISEVHNDGHIYYSKTAHDDFFFVEELSVESVTLNNERREAIIHNYSDEPVPVKIIEYLPGSSLQPNAIRAFEVQGKQSFKFSYDSEYTFINYNEEREWIFVHHDNEPVVIRNPEVIILKKAGENQTYLISKVNEDSFILKDELLAIWNLADGLHTRNHICTKTNRSIYDEMLAENLIKEISKDSSVTY